MKNIDRWFVLTGLAFLLVGMALGLRMAMSMNFTMHGLHAHLNLLGFVVMTLFGLCYHSWPAMQEGILPRVHYVLHTATVAVALYLLYRIMANPELGETLGPIMNMILMGTYAGVVLFTYLFFSRTKTSA